MLTAPAFSSRLYFLSLSLWGLSVRLCVLLDIWDAAKWAEIIVTSLIGHDWSITTLNFSDRDTRYMSEFWTTIFKCTKVSIPNSTAYHPQIDGQCAPRGRLEWGAPFPTSRNKQRYANLYRVCTRRIGIGIQGQRRSGTACRRYEQSHRPAKITPWFMVYPRLHQGYTIPGLSNRSYPASELDPSRWLSRRQTSLSTWITTCY